MFEPASPLDFQQLPPASTADPRSYLGHTWVHSHLLLSAPEFRFHLPAADGCSIFPLPHTPPRGPFSRATPSAHFLQAGIAATPFSCIDLLARRGTGPWWHSFLFSIGTRVAGHLFPRDLTTFAMSRLADMHWLISSLTSDALCVACPADHFLYATQAARASFFLASPYLVTLQYTSARASYLPFTRSCYRTDTRISVDSVLHASPHVSRRAVFGLHTGISFALSRVCIPFSCTAFFDASDLTVSFRPLLFPFTARPHAVESSCSLWTS